jgi:hypothetical protein
MQHLAQKEKEKLLKTLEAGKDFIGKKNSYKVPVKGVKKTQNRILDCTLEVLKRGRFTIATITPKEKNRAQAVGTARRSFDDKMDIIHDGINKAIGKALHSLNKQYNGKPTYDRFAG